MPGVSVSVAMVLVLGCGKGYSYDRLLENEEVREDKP